MKSLSFTRALSASLLFLASALHADVVTVTNNLDDVANPPPGSLRHAIATAASGDTIEFSAVVTGTITLGGAELLLDKDLTITGPGATVLAISGSGSSRIFRIPSGANVAVHNLTIRDGKADDGTNGTEFAAAQSGAPGGAILSAGNLTATNCVFSNNSAGNGGNTSFGNAGAGAEGGAIASSGLLSFTRCTFASNHAGAGGNFSSQVEFASGRGGWGGDGGAISSAGGGLQMVECSITSNQAGKGGDAPKSADSQVPTPGSGGSGGGIFASGDLLIDRCCIASNSSGNSGFGYMEAGAGRGGGLAVSQTGTGQINTSTISGNRAGDAGPFQWMHAGGAGGSGGGISSGGNLAITSCTITNNSVGKRVSDTGQNPGDGSGISAGGSLAMWNSLVSGNLLAFDVSGTYAAYGSHTLVGGNPFLAPLADNGGPTHTHAFSGNSPAINAGDDSIDGTDQRGQPRLTGDHVDVGAFEAALPAISFLHGTSAVQEGAGSATVTIKRNQAIDAPASVQYASKFFPAFDSANPGVDFAIVSSTINFAAGQAEATVNIPILQDNHFERPEPFLLTLSDAGGTQITGPNSIHTVTIVDDEEPPTFEFAAAASLVNETAGKVFVTVKRTGSSDTSALVNYATADGSASTGNDYTDKSGWIAFGPGVLQQTIEIPILNDPLAETDETFMIRLFRPSDGAVLGNMTTHIVTIQSDEIPPTLGFESNSSTVLESTGNALVKVRRTGPNTGAISVNYQSSSGSAETDSDFDPVSGTITFSGDTAEQTVAIPISNDDVIEGSETFTLTLSLPTNDAVIGENSTHTVTILDDDGPAIVSFANAASSVPESSGEISVTLQRTGNASIAASVQVAANGGSALGGTDYSFQDTTVEFPSGATERTVTLVVINDSDEESDEDVVLALSNPAGANLGAQTTHTVTILDDAEDLSEIRKASYRGLAQSAETDIPEFGGVAVKTTDAGRLTGTLRIRGKTLPLHGRFSENRTFSQEFTPRALGGSSGGNLLLEPDEDGAVLRGTFDYNGGATFLIEMRREVVGTKVNPVPQANAYTALLDTQLDNNPAGLLRASVAASGRISLSAMLPDGTRLTASTHLTEDQSFPIFLPAYRKKIGYLAGPAEFVAGTSLPLAGELHWKKPADSRPPYADGFNDELVDLSGAVYTPPQRQRILDDFDGLQGLAILQLSGEESSTLPDIDLTWTERNAILPTSPNFAQARITLQPRTGLWSGSFRDPSGVRRRLHGICIQQPEAGEDLAAGFYIGETTSGRIELQPED